MIKLEAISFINNLEEDADGKIFFLSIETLDILGPNVRGVHSTKAMMLDRLEHNFDDNLHGSFRDGVLTTIVSMDVLSSL